MGRKGYDVTVITCAPNFPHWKVYEGYKNMRFNREEKDGSKVIRIWTYITANEVYTETHTKLYFFWMRKE